MTAVLDFAEVTIRRGQATLLDAVSWRVEEGDRWVILGPNGAGKTTLLQVASAQIHPTSGVAGILDEVLGTVDVFELRPRIGLTSAALAERIPRSERVHDVVVSASYGVVGRWREAYDELPPGFTHALLLRRGRVVAVGPVAEVVTEANLAATFGMPLALRHEDGRWSARRRTRHL